MRHRHLLFGALSGVVLLVGFTGGGCARDVRVQRADPSSTLREQLTTRLTSERLSGLTRDALAMASLDRLAREEPLEAIDRLRELAKSEPDAAWRLAASELLLDAAEDASPPDASLYLASAFEADLEVRRAVAQGGGLLDERTEFAADLYHRAISRWLSLSSQVWLRDDVAESVDGVGGTFSLAFDGSPSSSSFAVGDFDSLVPADQLRVLGMRTHHRLDAYGVPVVAIREQADAQPPRSEAFIPPEGLIVPATVTLRFDSPSDVAIELWNPDRVRAIERHGAPLRLSTDTTAPIAELFSRAELARTGARGMTDVGEYVSRIGIYLHEPFDPQKIPVLLVHGLRSSPVTWRDMLNDLRADHVLRERFQFWMFYYPTGLPVPRSAAYLRRELAEIRSLFDPNGLNPRMSEMVVVGHSMGGLLTKANVQSSGDALWHSLHPEPFDEIDMPPGVRDHIREVFFYDADEGIARVVFIATPHAGSTMATSWIGRLGDSLVDLPDEFDDVDEWFASERQRLDPSEEYQLTSGVPSSIDDLRPGAPHLRAYSSIPMRTGLPFHVIAGGQDSIVPLDSSMLEGADSAIIVDAGHNAHTHARAIREVRRILLLHLDDRR